MVIHYAWIKDFKNIKRQAVSLSDKYIINYNHLDGELSIKENPNYFPDFFGVNIKSVSGIIGANGTGKSSLLDFLKIRIASYTNGAWHSFEEGLEAIFIFDGRIFCHCNLKLKNISYLRKLKFKIYYYKGSLATLSEKRNQQRRNYVYQDFAIFQNRYIAYSNVFDSSAEGSWMNLSNVTTNYLIETDRNRFAETSGIYQPKPISELEAYQLNEVSRQINFLAQQKVDMPFPLPKNLNITLQNEENANLNRESSWIIENDLVKINAAFDEYVISDRRSTKLSIEKFQNLFLYNLLRTLSYQDPSRFNKMDISDMRDIIERSQWHKFKDYISDNDFTQLKEVMKNLDIVLKTAVFPPTRVSANLSIWDKYGRIGFSIEGARFDVVKSLIFSYQILVQEKGFLSYYWEGLSSGQMNMLTFYSRLYEVMTNLKKDSDSKHIVVMIDEGETYFHPQWQKDYLKNIIDFLPQIFPQNTLQIIITSNSPFIASDLPKSMINFLDKDENGHCIVVDGLTNHKQTFGANIHTLYTDAFFMSNSLIGQFAQDKINKLIKIINLDEPFNGEFNSWNKIQRYINIIGEPILRNVLQKQLDSSRLSKIDEIDDIKQQIKKLESKINMIQNSKDK